MDYHATGIAQEKLADLIKPALYNRQGQEIKAVLEFIEVEHKGV